MSSRTSLSYDQRRGLILLLLLLGPAPLALLIFLLGTATWAVTAVSVASALLVGVLFWLYRGQRLAAHREGRQTWPLGQVAGLLIIVAGVAGGTFLLVQPTWSPLGLACCLVSLGTTYAMGWSLRAETEEPDERSTILLLGLMATLIALAHTCL